MYQTNLSWTADTITCVIGGEVTRILRMTNNQAEKLFNELSIRAANSNLFDKDGTFTVGGIEYDMTAGVWASVHSSLEYWYEEYFDGVLGPEMFGPAPQRPKLRIV